VTDTYTYDVYGAVRTRTGTSPNEFTFTGEQVDSSGLQYLRARYYDAATGRFASRDPLPLMQRYGYVWSNPTNLVDPYGLYPGEHFVRKAKQAVSSAASETLDTLAAVGDAERAVGGALVDRVVNNVTDPKLLAKDAQVIAGAAFVGCLFTPGADFVCAGAAAVTYGAAVARQYYLADSTHERVFLIASLGLESLLPGVAGEISSDLADTFGEPATAEAPGLYPSSSYLSSSKE
jgi:RHS repeat-associated protein